MRAMSEVRGEVESRSPAAAHREEVGAKAEFSGAGESAVRVNRADFNVVKVVPAVRGRHSRTRDDRDAVAHHLRDLRRVGRLAGVNDRRDLHAGLNQRKRGRVGAVVVRQKNGTVAGLDREAIDILRRRVRKHHAGKVVAGENHRALNSPAGENGFFRAKPPESLPRRGIVGGVGGGEVLMESPQSVVVGGVTGRPFQKS